MPPSSRPPCRIKTVLKKQKSSPSNLRNTPAKFWVPTTQPRTSTPKSRKISTARVQNKPRQAKQGSVKPFTKVPFEPFPILGPHQRVALDRIRFSERFLARGYNYRTQRCVYFG